MADVSDTYPPDVVREAMAALLADADSASKLAAADAAIADKQAKQLALQTATLAHETALQDQRERASVLGRQAKDADSRKAIAQADQEITKAAKDAADAWTPDLSALKAGTTTIETKPVIFASRLAALAIADAARGIGEQVSAVLTAAPARVLLTHDASLVDSDEIHVAFVETAGSHLESARSSLDALKAEGDVVELSIPVEHVDRLREEKQQRVSPVLAALAGAVPLATAGQAAIKLIPQALSLLAVNRTVTAATVDSDVMSAHAAVARELIGLSGVAVVHDEFRLVQSAAIMHLVHELNDMASELDSAAIACDVYLSNVQRVENPSTPEEHAAAAAHDRVTAHKADFVTRSTVIKQFLVDSATVQAGSTRSVLASAAMRDQLYGTDATFDFVMLVPKPLVDTSQVLSDRTVGWDRLSVAGSASLSFLLLDTRAGNIAAAGLVNGSASMQGRVGMQLTLDASSAPQPRGVSWWVVARGLLLTAAGLFLLLSPTLTSMSFVIVATAVLVQEVIGGVQSLVDNGRMPQWPFLFAQALVALAVFVAIDNHHDWVVWGVVVYGVVGGLLGIRSGYGLAASTTHGLLGLVGALGIAVGLVAAIIAIFIPAEALRIVPFAFGLYAAVVGLILVVLSIQDPKPAKRA